jgi:flavodoxin I
MKALVIYESFFGNTEKVARAIGEALSAGAEVEVVAVSDAGSDRLHGLDLLVLGAPTRAFKPGPATQAWLKALPPNALKGIKVAAFDTRIPVNEVKSRILPVLVKFFGYAAEPIGRGLAKAGGLL